MTPVVLGLLYLGARSGYDIKTAVDGSTRFFWAASYGQIYPELRRLEREGLIEGEDSPNGARGRRVYHLTDAGRKALNDWLLGHGVTIELRDESLLRLFFADALRGSRRWGCWRLASAGTRNTSRSCRQSTRGPGKDPAFVDLVLRWGIAFNEWGAQWGEDQLEQLRAQTTKV